MDNMSKKGVKVRLLICLVVGISAFLLCMKVNVEPMPPYLIVMGPALMIAGASPYIFMPLDCIKRTVQCTIDIIGMVFYSIFLQFNSAGKSFKRFLGFLKWYLLAICTVLKKTFWAFSKK